MNPRRCIGLVLACLLGAAGPAAAQSQGSAPAPAPVLACEIGGQAVDPAEPASINGKSGLMRCKDASSGVLLRESNYSDGHEVGLARSWRPDGKLRRVSFREEGGSERAVAEYTARGQLSLLRCGDQPLLAPLVDDTRLCGFGRSVSTVELFDDNGLLRSRLGLLGGKRVRTESFYDNGKLAIQEEQVGSERIERRFSSEGVKRREVVMTVTRERAAPVRQRELEFSEKGTLVREQRWDAAGEPLRDDSFYADGKPRSKIGYSGSGDARVADVTEFHESGQRATQGRFLAPARAPLLPVGTHRRFNAQGVLVAESSYDAKGRAIRERSWSDTGELLRDDAVPGNEPRKGASQ
jgi:antitoxin component YwqK of YwqJK toxin-antitoxin module